MRCSRCGETAVVTRGEQDFCGRCALAYDWEEIIAIAQEAAGEALPVAPPASPAPSGRSPAPV